MADKLRGTGKWAGDMVIALAPDIAKHGKKHIDIYHAKNVTTVRPRPFTSVCFFLETPKRDKGPAGKPKFLPQEIDRNPGSLLLSDWGSQMW